MKNLKFALRALKKTPFVTAVAILSLALGIGANAAIFSLFEQMVLRPLPVPAADRLVNLSAPGPKPGSQSCTQAGDCDQVFSYPMFRDLEQKQTVFTGLAAHRVFGANLAFEGQTLNSSGMLVSGSYFGTLGLRPALGRLLTPEDDRTVGAHYVAVVSHGFWQGRLGGERDVLGEQIIVNGHPLTIVGVAPPGFTGTTMGTQADVFVPLTMRGQMSPGFDQFENRRAYWTYVFGRLKPGVDMERARAALNAIYTPILNDVEAPLQQGMSDETMARFRQKQIGMEDGRRGQSELHRLVRVPILLLMAITAIVLVIACANIANLLLARAAARAQELSIRLSLGASRRQLLGQLLTESVVLAVLGGLASLLVARWTLSLVRSFLPTDGSQFFEVGLSVPALLFTGAVALGAGVLFGLFPALHSTRPDLVRTLRESAGQIQGGARAASRFRSTLVTAQIALSMTLLVAAGLLIKSLVNVSRVNLGVRVEDVVTFAISPELSGYSPERARILFDRVEEELAALPGATGVTSALIPLFANSNWGSSVAVEGFEAGPDTDVGARVNIVSPGYFRTLGVPLLSGREFTAADDAGRPLVAVVNESFLRKFGLTRDAVGKRMSQSTGGPLNMEIVGVVQDQKYSEVKGAIPPMFYMPIRQDTTVGSAVFYVRTSQSPEQTLRAIPGVIARLDPNLPVEQLKTLPQQVRENVYADRMISSLAAGFAALATLLAAIGLYGVLAYTVAQRTREIGVRMALGADARRVRGMVLRHVRFMLLVGGVIGVGAALALGRTARSLLFEVEANDPVVVALAAAVLTLVALAAGYLPARKATRVDPMTALRSN